MNSITAIITTGSITPPATGGPLSDAKTTITKGDGEAYLCVGGREYWLNTDSTSGIGDFANGVTTEFRFGGTTPNANDGPFNDPNRFFVLTLENVRAFPVWIRFRPVPGSSGAFWWLKGATVKVQVGAVILTYAFDSPDGLWLGGSEFRDHATGHFCFLRKVGDPSSDETPTVSDCVIKLGKPIPLSVDKRGGSVTVHVHANHPTCDWEVESLSSNVTVNGPASGPGSKAVTFDVGRSPEPTIYVPPGGPLHAFTERFIQIAGQTVVFRQFVFVEHYDRLDS